MRDSHDGWITSDKAIKGPNALREEWNRVARSLGLEVKMYEGTKHAFASDAVARGVDLYRLRDFLGHTDARSTER